MPNNSTLKKLPIRARKSSPIDRFFLEIVLGLVVIMIISWSPEKGVSPISPDELTKPQEQAPQGGVSLKNKKVAISPSGYWLDGKLISKELLFEELKKSSVDLIALEPRDNTEWKQVAELWSNLNDNNYNVTLSH
ncbi:hypothetical protein [Pseudoalteromonas sp. C12FD-1]|uniref:hypothetical protein n=1 Tax=Pseudoalteromonas sp. C12FD-1 TaxID=3131979 RepID=UPI00307FBA72